MSTTMFNSLPNALCGSLDQVLEGTANPCGQFPSLFDNDPYGEEEEYDVIEETRDAPEASQPPLKGARANLNRVQKLQNTTEQMSEGALSYREMAAKLKEKSKADAKLFGRW